MKKLLYILLSVIIIFSLTACAPAEKSEPGNAENKSASSTPAEKNSNSEISKAPEKPSYKDYDPNDPESMKKAVTLAFESASTQIAEDGDNLIGNMGSTYSDYLKNEKLADEFYEKAIADSSAIYNDVEAIANDYYKCIGSMDYPEWKVAANEFYDLWINGVDSYDTAWNDAKDKIYGHFELMIDTDSDDIDADETTATWNSMFNKDSAFFDNMFNSETTFTDAMYDIERKAIDDFEEKLKNDIANSEE